MIPESPKAKLANPPPCCPACKAERTGAGLSFLNPQTGKTIRVYKCQCGERIWDD
jgi:hypothetical protein